MKSPAMAMLWESFTRQRWLTLTISAEFAILFVLARVMPHEWLEDPSVNVIGLLFVIYFFLGVAAMFGVSAEQPRTGRQGYPERMYLYPISTRRLVMLPMLFEMAAMVVSWVVMAMLILRPMGFHPPVATVAIALAAAMAWLQAAVWWPFRSDTSARLVAFLVMLPALAMAVAWPMIVRAGGTAVGLAISIAYIIAALIVAMIGVTLDRCGARQGDREASRFRDRFESLIEVISGPQGPFRSASRAQFWLEWRTKGRGVVILVGSLAFVTATFLAVFSGVVGGVRIFLLILFAEHCFICSIFGVIFAKDDPSKRSILLSPFVATRPMTSGRMAGLKIGAAAASLLVSYAVVLALIPIWLIATGNLSSFGLMLKPVVESKGVGFVVLIAALGLVVVLGTTWRGMIGGMLPVLTGRHWVSNMLAFALILGLIVVLGLTLYMTLHQTQRMAWATWALAAIPWLMGGVLGLKLIVGTVAFRKALRRGLISLEMLAGSVAVWAVFAACVMGFMALLLRPIEVSTWITLAIGSAIVPPFGRLALAPMALDWNRHQ